MPSTILSDNGVSSGSAGLKTTAASDGTLALQTTTAAGTATTAVSIDTSQNATFVNAANLPNTFGFKNRIINGNMTIDQRNAGASITQSTSSLYGVDRWNCYGSTAGAFTMQQNAGSVTPPTGFKNYLGVTVISPQTFTTGNLFHVSQTIEGYNTADLGFGAAGASTVTLSFWVRSSLTGSFGGCLLNSAGDRSYPFSYTISSANTWEQKTITIAGDTSGTWLTTNGAGISLLFGMGSGTNYKTTANAWAAGTYTSPTGSVNLVSTNGATWYVTGVQLEKGTQATSFDFRSYGTEVSLCQRYYFQHSGAWNGVNFYYYPVGGRLGTTSSAAVTLSFPVTMRSAPTFTQIGAASTWINSGTGNTKGITLVTDVATSQSINLNGTFTAIAGSAAGNGIVMYQDATSTTALQFSAEL